MEGAQVATTLHGAIPRLTCDGERRAHRQASMLMRRRVSTIATPHRAVPRFAHDGGRHTSPSVHAWTDGVVGRRHTAWSHSQTRPLWWEEHNGKHPCLDGGVATPTVLELSRDSFSSSNSRPPGLDNLTSDQAKGTPMGTHPQH